jgi:hypothetical protein
MDLDRLENKLKQMKNDSQPFSPSSQIPKLTANNPFTTMSETIPKKNKAPVNITTKINEISVEDVKSYSDKVIPNWKDLQSIYEGQWNKEKDKFQTHLKSNFAALVERFASGKQELFQLVAPERREKLYIEAFLELFESGYAPHVGDIERIANKRVRKLFITLPNNYSSIY